MDTEALQRRIVDQVRLVMYGDGSLEEELYVLAHKLEQYDGVPLDLESNRLLKLLDVVNARTSTHPWTRIFKALRANVILEPKSKPSLYQLRVGQLYLTLTGDHRLTINYGAKWRLFDGLILVNRDRDDGSRPAIQ